MGFLDSLLGGSGDDSAKYYDKALEGLASINVPKIEDMMLNLQQYQSAGTLNPILEQLQQMGPSAYEQVSSDPRLRQEQMSALEGIAQIADSGMRPGDAAAFQLARNNAAGEAQAKSQQILQEMQARGQGGSGAELISRLQGSQSGAQMLQDAQLKEAMARQQAMQQALQQQASMASGIRGQDNAEASQLASARDAITQFNAQNAQSVNSRNTNTQNTAQASNLQNAQNIANQNVGSMNQQQQYNKQLQQQRFNNQMQLQAAKNGVYGQQANVAQQQAANSGAQIGGLLQAGGTIIGGIYGGPAGAAAGGQAGAALAKA